MIQNAIPRAISVIGKAEVGPRITDNRLLTTDHGLRDHGLRDRGLRTTERRREGGRAETLKLGKPRIILNDAMRRPWPAWPVKLFSFASWHLCGSTRHRRCHPHHQELDQRRRTDSGQGRRLKVRLVVSAAGESSMNACGGPRAGLSSRGSAKKRPAHRL